MTRQGYSKGTMLHRGYISHSNKPQRAVSINTMGNQQRMIPTWQEERAAVGPAWYDSLHSTSAEFAATKQNIRVSVVLCIVV